jgi:hypothetical protein
MDSHVYLLAVCNFPPFTYVTGSTAYGPWVSLAMQALPVNATHAFVLLDSRMCNSAGMLATLASGAAHVAVFPMLMDSPCEGCVWSYPLSSNGLLMVSGLESVRRDPFFGSFSWQTWAILAALVVVFMVASVVLERRRERWRTLCYSFLTLLANLHLPEDASAATFVLYTGMTLCSTMVVAVYTANLTASVLQERKLTGMNVRAFVNAGNRFSVAAGPPADQMALEYPGAAYNIVPGARAGTSLPCLMLWEQGTVIVEGSCDPVAAVSGAINRLPLSMAFAGSLPYIDDIRSVLQEMAQNDVSQREMLAWIPQKYQCLRQQAVKIEARMLAPLAVASLAVYIFACVWKIVSLSECSARLRRWLATSGDGESETQSARGDERRSLQTRAV